MTAGGREFQVAGAAQRNVIKLLIFCLCSQLQPYASQFKRKLKVHYF